MTWTGQNRHSHLWLTLTLKDSEKSRSDAKSSASPRGHLVAPVDYLRWKSVTNKFLFILLSAFEVAVSFRKVGDPWCWRRYSKCPGEGALKRIFLKHCTVLSFMYLSVTNAGSIVTYKPHSVPSVSKQPHLLVTQA